MTTNCDQKWWPTIYCKAQNYQCLSLWNHYFFKDLYISHDMCTLWFGEKDRQAYLYWRWQCHWPRRQIGIGSWNGFNWILSQGYNLTKLNKSTKEIFQITYFGSAGGGSLSMVWTWMSICLGYLLLQTFLFGYLYSSNIFWGYLILRTFFGLYSYSNIFLDYLILQTCSAQHSHIVIKHV